MKKLVIIIIVLLIALSFTADTKAMEYMAGAKTGYYAWQPFLKDAGGSGMSDIGWGTGMLYGPIVSLIFSSDVSFSVAGLIGKQSTHWQSMYSDFDGNKQITGTYYFEAFRADFDSALSLKISDNFKVFTGYKYQYLNMTYSYTELRTNIIGNVVSEIYVSKMDNMKSPSHGPALGIGMSFPIGMKYFFAANISCLYTWGKTQMKNKMYSSDGVGDPLILERDESFSVKNRQIGLNFEPSIGFSAGEGLPIISLGFRYQHFWLKFIDAPPDSVPDKNLDDTLIGGFLSAVYMF